MRQIECDFIPSSFDPDDPDLKALPRPHGWRWSSCEAALKEFGTRGLMVRLPLFWQIIPPLHESCRTLGIPIFINDLANMPLGAAALLHAGVDTVIAEAGDATQFAAFLKQNKLSFPKAWLVIHRANDAWNIPETLAASSLVQEVHLSPGVVLLSQCPELMRQKKPLFHDERAEKSDLRAFRLVEKGTCACGRTILGRA